MMERLLERIAVSGYRENFILKGGFLIAAIVGIGARSTMDMDATIKGLPVNESSIKDIITEILSIPINDNVTFELSSIKPIHDDVEYKDFRVSIIARFFTIKNKYEIRHDNRRCYNTTRNRIFLQTDV